MSFSARSPPLDLEAGLRTTSADTAALRRSRSSGPVDPQDFLDFLAQFETHADLLRARRGPRGEPFTLPQPNEPG